MVEGIRELEISLSPILWLDWTVRFLSAKVMSMSPVELDKLFIPSNEIALAEKSPIERLILESVNLPFSISISPVLVVREKLVKSESWK